MVKYDLVLYGATGFTGRLVARYLDNVPDLARHFFSRCLEAEVVPYVVTKKTVFKWQEGFWAAMAATTEWVYGPQRWAAGRTAD